MNSRVGRSQRILLGAQLARVVLFILTMALLGRWLSPAELGFVALVSGVFLIGHEVMDLGTTAVTTRRVAQARINERSALGTLLAYRRMVGTALAVVVLLAACSDFVQEHWQRAVLAAAGLSMLLTHLSAYHVVFQTRQAFGRASALALAVQLGFLLATACVLQLKPLGWLTTLGAGAATGLLVVARELVQVLASRWLAVKMLGTRLRAAWLDPDIPSLLRSTWVFGLAGLGYRLSALAGSFFIWGLLTPQDLGSFSAAQRLFGPVTDAAWLFATPLLAAMSQIGTKPQAVRLQLTALTQLLLACSCGVAVAGQFVAPLVLELLYGGQYSQGPASAVAIFQWLSLALGFSLVTPVLAMACLAQGRERLLMQASISGLLLNLVLNAALIPLEGPVGAAKAWCASEALVMLTLLANAARRGQIAGGWDWLAYLLPAACLAVVLRLLSAWPGVQLGVAGAGLALGLVLLRTLPSQQASRAAPDHSLGAHPT